MALKDRYLTLHRYYLDRLGKYRIGGWPWQNKNELLGKQINKIETSSEAIRQAYQRKFEAPFKKTRFFLKKWYLRWRFRQLRHQHWWLCYVEAEKQYLLLKETPHFLSNQWCERNFQLIEKINLCRSRRFLTKNKGVFFRFLDKLKNDWWQGKQNPTEEKTRMENMEEMLDDLFILGSNEEHSKDTLTLNSDEALRQFNADLNKKSNHLLNDLFYGFFSKKRLLDEKELSEIDEKLNALLESGKAIKNHFSQCCRHLGPVKK